MMKITNLHLDETNRFIHDSVYKTSATKEFLSLVKNKQSDLFKGVSIKESLYLQKQAALIVYIHRRSRALMASIVEVLDGDDKDYAGMYRSIIDTVSVEVNRSLNLTSEQFNASRSRLVKMVSCTPNQGFSSVPKLRQTTSCDQYRLCPWCRYRKARQIFDAFLPYLTTSHQICVTHFDTLCDPENLSVLCEKKSYSKITKAINAGRDWICDYMITLPTHVRGGDGVYRLMLRTSLIAIVPAGQPLCAPEALAPKNLDDASIVSDGVVLRFPGSSDGLTDAFKRVVGYPKWMLFPTLTDKRLFDILTVLALGDRFRAEPHGFSAQ